MRRRRWWCWCWWWRRLWRERGREGGVFNSPTTIFSVPFIRHKPSSRLLSTNFLHVDVGCAASLRLCRCRCRCRRCCPGSAPLRGWCVIISSGEAEADILPRSGGALTPRGHPRTRAKVKPPHSSTQADKCAFTGNFMRREVLNHLIKHEEKNM